jgi:hypothetical protein
MAWSAARNCAHVVAALTVGETLLSADEAVDTAASSAARSLEVSDVAAPISAWRTPSTAVRTARRASTRRCAVEKVATEQERARLGTAAPEDEEEGDVDEEEGDDVDEVSWGTAANAVAGTAIAAATVTARAMSRLPRRLPVTFPPVAG